MRSHRGGRIGSRFLAAGFVFLTALSGQVLAQPGFGPDPFWPYNQQYAPYTSPIGPASPTAGQGNSQPQAGFRGANQFQDYLDGMQGPGRNASDRSTIGMPYYRSSVTPDADISGRGIGRQYRPNSSSANTNYDTAQRLAAEKYFAYYSERDPARRRELMREYRELRQQASRALNSRVRMPASAQGSSSRTRTAPGSTTRPEATTARSGGSDRTPSGRGTRIGPAPAIPSYAPGRSTDSTRRRSSGPAGVLERSQAMDRLIDADSESRTTARPSRSRSARPARTPAAAPDTP